jgi:hypothetical protein
LEIIEIGIIYRTKKPKTGCPNMKIPSAAIIVFALAFGATSAFADSVQKPSEASAEQVIEGLGLLMDSPKSPVGEIYDFSTIQT